MKGCGYVPHPRKGIAKALSLSRAATPIQIYLAYPYASLLSPQHPWGDFCFHK